MSHVYGVVPPYVSQKILEHYEALQNAELEREEPERKETTGRGDSRTLASSSATSSDIDDRLSLQMQSMFRQRQVRSLRTEREHSLSGPKVWFQAPHAASSPPAPRQVWDLKSGGRGRLILSTSANLSSSNPPPEATTCFENMRFIDEFLRTQLKVYAVNSQSHLMKAYINAKDAYNNAYWYPSAQAIFFGEVDPAIFTPLILNYGIIAHEFSHAVTSYSADLEYSRQSGALNESVSDVFASVMKQYRSGQGVEDADWLIGEGTVVNRRENGTALRSMSEPGNAYRNHPIMGNDPQPNHMNDYQNLPNTEAGDWGGVHINSGTPNKAFYLASMAIQQNTWESTGKIWYEALKNSNSQETFSTFAGKTMRAVKTLGFSEEAQNAVGQAWSNVGVVLPRRGSGPIASSANSEDGVESVNVQLPHDINITISFKKRKTVDDNKGDF